MKKTTTGVNTTKGVNKKVVINSVIALACITLMYLVHWLFVIPAVYLVWINQKELIASRPQAGGKK